MKLYDYPGSANAYKAKLLLAELEIPYERVLVDIFLGEAKTPEFLAKNPAAQVPVLELDDGRCIPQSNAILWYLARGTAFLPSDPFVEATVASWLFFEQSDVEPIIGSAQFWIMTGRDKDRRDELARRIEIGRRSLTVMDGVLRTRAYFAGDAYTIADIALYAYSHLAPRAGLDLASYPNVLAWMRRIEARPKFFEGPDPYGASARVAS